MLQELLLQPGVSDPEFIPKHETIDIELQIQYYALYRIFFFFYILYLQNYLITVQTWYHVRAGPSRITIPK